FVETLAARAQPRDHALDLRPQLVRHPWPKDALGGLAVELPGLAALVRRRDAHVLDNARNLIGQQESMLEPDALGRAFDMNVDPVVLGSLERAAQRVGAGFGRAGQALAPAGTGGQQHAAEDQSTRTRHASTLPRIGLRLRALAQ